MRKTISLAGHQEEDIVRILKDVETVKRVGKENPHFLNYEEIVLDDEQMKLHLFNKYMEGIVFKKFSSQFILQNF